MNFERLLDLLADNQREREKLSDLLVWITEGMAAEVLTRANKSARRGIRLKRAVKNEVIGLTLRHLAGNGSLGGCGSLLVDGSLSSIGSLDIAAFSTRPSVGLWRTTTTGILTTPNASGP